MISKVILLLCIAFSTIAFGEQAYLDGYRQMSRAVPFGEKIAYCSEKCKILSPVDRSRVLAILWERLPTTIEISDYSSVVDMTNVAFVITSAYCGRGEIEQLNNAGFYVCHTNEEAVLLSRRKLDERLVSIRFQSIEPTWFYREIVALSIFGAIFVLIWWGVAINKGVRFSPIVIVIAIGMFAIYSISALGHTFWAPNGLGVYGGKAKWLYMAGRDFSPFLANRAFELMQIAYPPGLTLLTYAYYLVSGGCGDWLIQLLAVTPMPLTYLTLESRNRSWLFRAFLLSIFFSPVALKLVNGFYAEPFAFLCVAMGVKNFLNKGKSWWVIFGAASLFRFECLPALVIVYLWNGKRFSAKETYLLAGSSLIGLLWIICVTVSPFRIADIGAGGLDWHRLCHFKDAFTGLVDYYGVSLLIMIAILLRRIREHRYIAKMLFGLVLWGCFFAIGLLVDGSSFPAWKVGNLMPRLFFLWCILFAAQNEEDSNV